MCRWQQHVGVDCGSPALSIEDRSDVGPAEQVLNSTEYILAIWNLGSRCNNDGCNPVHWSLDSMRRSGQAPHDVLLAGRLPTR